MSLKKQNDERGSATVEFSFSTLVWLPLLLGTIFFGINLVHAIQVSQLSRDTAHMYAYGIDFTQSQNTALLGRLSGSLGITQTGGTGAIVLSTITLATQSECDAANVDPCSNRDKYVFTSIYVFGNQGIAQTKLGSHASQYFNKGTSITQKNYLSDSNLVADSFSSLLTFVANQPGQYAYASEVTVKSAINWSDFSSTGSYARSIF